MLVAASHFIGKLLRFERKMLGSLMTAAGITSTLTFALPFILVFYGQDAAHYLFLYDFGGAIIVWTFVYYMAGVMGNKRGDSFGKSLSTFVKTLMIWALTVGFGISFLGVELPDAVNAIAAKLGGFVGVMLFMGIGAFFNFDSLKHKKNVVKIAAGIIITMGLSGLLAHALTALFGVSGLA